MIKYRLALTFFVSSLMFLGCGELNKDQQVAEELVSLSKIHVLDCEEIKQYPSLFSYKNEAQFNKLRTKGKQLLTDAEKQHLFVKANAIYMVFDPEYDVYPVSKIMYEKSALVIYLVRAKIHDGHPYEDDYPYEGDSMILVLYDQNGTPTVFLDTSLQDVFSTREINMLSAVDFEIIDTDDEYSPDPESEARDIANGSGAQTTITTSVYKIDTVKLQIELVKVVSEN